MATETLRCHRAETTGDCPVSHQWTESDGERRAYHATYRVHADALAAIERRPAPAAYTYVFDWHALTAGDASVSGTNGIDADSLAEAIDEFRTSMHMGRDLSVVALTLAETNDPDAGPLWVTVYRAAGID